MFYIPKESKSFFIWNFWEGKIWIFRINIWIELSISRLIVFYEVINIFHHRNLTDVSFFSSKVVIFKKSSTTYSSGYFSFNKNSKSLIKPEVVPISTSYCISCPRMNNFMSCDINLWSVFCNNSWRSKC